MYMSKVEEYIKKQNKVILEDREKTLIALGLTEKEYSPDYKEDFNHKKYDFINGERRYYRDVAIKVTDEEYELIISKAKQVEAIKAKEEEKLKDAQKKKHTKVIKVVKKWIPIFEKPQSKLESLFETEEKVDKGRSTIALILRVVAWITGIVALFTGIYLSIELNNALVLAITSGASAMGILLLLALAEILDRLAELTSIERNGLRYTEDAE